jgi:AraC family transcriptional regulator, regulatory protein of adaptative response / methylated-DNA-[protein]-cysteine methyltransferase
MPAEVEYLAEYLQEHAEDTIPLERMSEITGFSPFHLQRKFKAAYGVSPKQFQDRCRMERVKRALRDRVPVTDALYAAGFGSSSRLYERAGRDLGMTPAQYQAKGKGIGISYVTFASRLGHVLIAATERGLCALRLGDSPAALAAELGQEFANAELKETEPPFAGALRVWEEAIQAYLAGIPIPEGLPLDIQGTAFQARVWQYLQSIPAGETRSYSEVAEGIGKPSATRAVANACGANPVALAVPCHRVIRSGGALGGYRWGIERKEAILALENKRH